MLGMKLWASARAANALTTKPLFRPKFGILEIQKPGLFGLKSGLAPYRVLV